MIFNFHIQECIKRWLEGFVINPPTCPVCRAIVYITPEGGHIVRIRLQSVQESPNTVDMIDEMKKQQVKLHESLIGEMTAAAKRSEDAIMTKLNVISVENEMKQKQLIALGKKIVSLEKQLQKMMENAEKCKSNAHSSDLQQIRHVSTQRVSTRVRRPSVKRLGMTNLKPHEFSTFSVVKPTIVIGEFNNTKEFNQTSYNNNELSSLIVEIDTDETSNVNFNPQSTSAAGKTSRNVAFRARRRV